MAEIKEVAIYTDGACRGNPGPGGTGTILIYGEHRKELSTGYRWTTNNRMELRALIHGLAALRYRCQVAVYSDSRYVLDAWNRGWIQRWKRNGWRTKERQPVKNADLWRELEDLLRAHDVTLHWVAGHTGQPENERCDELAVKAAKGRKLQRDEAYEALVPPSPDVARR